MIPHATTTIRVERPTPAIEDERDPYEPVKVPAGLPIAEGVRAVIGVPSGRADRIGGNRQHVEYTLTADPVELTANDIVVDESSGERYKVDWVITRPGIPGTGLEHVTGGLLRA